VNDTKRPPLNQYTPPKREPLPRLPTLAQWRVVVQIWSHENNYDVAARNLGITVQTVKMHVEHYSRWLPGHGPPAWKVLRYGEEIVEAGYREGYNTRTAA
jgi:hypothetical protein